MKCDITAIHQINMETGSKQFLVAPGSVILFGTITMLEHDILASLLYR